MNFTKLNQIPRTFLWHRRLILLTLFSKNARKFWCLIANRTSVALDDVVILSIRGPLEVPALSSGQAVHVGKLFDGPRARKRPPGGRSRRKTLRRSEVDEKGRESAADICWPTRYVPSGKRKMLTGGNILDPMSKPFPRSWRYNNNPNQKHKKLHLDTL